MTADGRADMLQICIAYKQSQLRPVGKAAHSCGPC
jgi:hypothetical protein